MAGQLSRLLHRVVMILTHRHLYQMLQTAPNGSYEHRALMYVLFEIRRALYSSLEEWEFLEDEEGSALDDEGGLLGLPGMTVPAVMPNQTRSTVSWTGTVCPTLAAEYATTRSP